jgi:hypothetical protein
VGRDLSNYSTQIKENHLRMAFHQREVVAAVNLSDARELRESFAGVQLSLGVLLQNVAAFVVNSEHTASTCAIDALGLISRACQLLDSAFDETHDRRAQALIRQQIVNSLEQAVSIKDKLSCNDYAGNSHPLRWVFVYVVRMADSLGEVEPQSREGYKKGATLLIDFVLSETDNLESSQQLSQEEESVRQEQINALETLRNRLGNA